METPFYIGQKIVAVENHPQGYFSKDEVFNVLGIKKDCCDIVVKIFDTINTHKVMRCSCGNEVPDNYYYFKQSRFAPIQEISEITYNEVMEWIEQGKKISILN